MPKTPHWSVKQSGLIIKYSTFEIIVTHKLNRSSLIHLVKNKNLFTKTRLLKGYAYVFFAVTTVPGYFLLRWIANQ